MTKELQTRRRIAVGPRWLPARFDKRGAERFRRPFHMFIIKVVSRCNLDCKYCYIYHGADSSWIDKPKFLSLSTAQAIANRIQEHVLRHSLADVSIVFHGGEPLLAGVARLEEYALTFRSIITCPIEFGMQTNGSLIDEGFIDLFLRYRFRLGVSLDGTKEHNDRNRRYHNGSSSYDDVVRAIGLLMSRPDYRSLFGGVLAVVDLRHRPSEILATLRDLGVRGVNLLLPDSNHASPPYRPDGDRVAYGRWLLEFFLLWIEEYPQIEVPYFEEIINLMMGGTSGSEEIGARSVDFVVVETNGDIEAVDTLKVVGREATSLGLNVFVNDFDEALARPAIYSRMSGYAALCTECRTCNFLETCGGGYLPHRYSSENGFVNPSVYCADLLYLFNGIRGHVFARA